jgi:hypothetical protein
MGLILLIFIVSLSTCLSLFTSGIEHNFIKSWYVPVYYYTLGYAFILYLFYKLRFKRIGVLKFYLLRKISVYNKAFRDLDNKVYSSKVELNSLQEKSIRSWNNLLKDKSTLLISYTFNSTHHKRTIQRGGLLLIFKSNNGENILTVLDDDKVNMYYEVFIPQSVANTMCNSFDKESETRMTYAENKKKNYLESLLP